MGALGDLVAVSSAMVHTVEALHRLCETSGPILLVGEPGTGKDYLARHVHEHQGRRCFVVVDCRDGEEALAKSLLGHYDAFYAEFCSNPEVEALQPGKLDEALEGTLYLDRIDQTSEKSEQMLLNLLRGDPYTPVGSDHSVEQGNILIIASCQAYPMEPTSGTHLSRDLLDVFGERVVRLPRLREREQDLRELFRLFSIEIAPNIAPDVTPEAEKALAQHDWPNNLWDFRMVTRRILAAAPSEGELSERAVQEQLLASAASSSQPKEHLRRERCSSLAKGLIYQDRQVEGSELYEWIAQFAPYRSESSIDPRDIAEHLIWRVCQEYFYSDARLKDMVKDLYQTLLGILSVDLLRENREQLTRKKIDRIRGHMVVTNPLGPMKSPDKLQLMFRSVAELVPSAQAVEFELLPAYLEKRKKTLKQGAAIVFVDDSIGSGRQFTTEILPRLQNKESLRRLIQENDGGPILFYMIVCVAHEEGLCRAREAAQEVSWLKVSIIPHTILRSANLAFSADSRVFPNPEIRRDASELIVERIGTQLAPGEDWTQSQGLVVFCHNTPNNTLAVIRKNGMIEGKPWKAIFPRMRAG